MFKIKNIEFLNCFEFVTEVFQYRILEDLVYSSDCEKELNMLKSMGCEDFVKNLNIETKSKFNLELKRKNIKENLLINYIVTNNLNKKDFTDLNMKIFLKTIQNKNIKITDGKIEEIIF